MLRIIVLGFLLMSCWGCGQKQPVSTTSQEGEDVPQKVAKSDREQAQEVLESYFDEIINSGTEGIQYWCEDDLGHPVKFFAPTQYKILRSEENTPLPTLIEHLAYLHKRIDFTVRLHSSNQGGMPIVADRRFFMVKEYENSDWCLRATYK